MVFSRLLGRWSLKVLDQRLTLRMSRSQVVLGRSTKLHPIFDALADRDRALIRSQARPGAGVALRVATTSRLTTIEPHLFRVVLLRRIRLPLAVRSCRCGRAIDILRKGRGSGAPFFARPLPPPDANFAECSGPRGPSLRWLRAMRAAARAVPSVDASDASARCCGTNGWHARWPWPSSRTMWM